MLFLLCLYLFLLVDLSDCTLYGVDEAVLTEAVILSYRGQPELGATLVKRRDHLTCHDFTMTQQLLAIQYSDCGAAHAETKEAVNRWLAGDLDAHLNNFTLLLDQVLIGDTISSPQTLAASGHADAVGVTEPHGYWDNWPSPAYFHTNSKRLGRLLDNLNSPALHVALEDENSHANLKWYISTTYESQTKWYLYEYMVSQLGSLHSFIMDLAAEELPSEDRAWAFIRKLYTFNEKFRAYKAHFKASQSIRAPSFIIIKVVTTVDRIISIIEGDPIGNPLMSNLQTQFDENIKAPMPEYMRDLARASISDKVVPTLKRFNEMLRSSLSKSQSTKADVVGVWAHPNGTAFYDASVKRYTTSYSTAHQLHELGIVEVAKIKRQMKDIIIRLNEDGETLLSPDYPMETNNDILREQDSFYYSMDNDTAIIESIKDIVTMIGEKMTPYFKTWPDIPLNIAAVPVYQQRNLPSAYYQPPTSKRNYGKFYINTGQPLSRIGVRSLVCHEAVPGHHFHISRIVSNPSLKKLFNAQIRYASTVEGWALYSEKLCAEHGVMTADLNDNGPNPLYNLLGQLNSQIFRAARLVVDTGIHSKRWTREKAIRFLQKNTAVPTEKIVSEVDRYIVWPGQALSYYSGMMEIIALKEAVREKQGASFDIAEFHETIIDQGSLPIAVMRQFVSEKYSLGLDDKDPLEAMEKEDDL